MSKFKDMSYSDVAEIARSSNDADDRAGAQNEKNTRDHRLPNPSPPSHIRDTNDYFDSEIEEKIFNISLIPIFIILLYSWYKSNHDAILIGIILSALLAFVVSKIISKFLIPALKIIAFLILIIIATNVASLIDGYSKYNSKHSIKSEKIINLNNK